MFYVSFIASHPRFIQIKLSVSFTNIDPHDLLFAPLGLLGEPLLDHCVGYIVSGLGQRIG